MPHLVVALLALYVLHVLARRVLAWHRTRHKRRPPWATGAVPLLGHALAYKADPADFLATQCRTVGNIFRINLAGKIMTVIGPDRAVTKRVASASESVLSARQAVLAIGFEETLGVLNVLEGTDLHKRAIKALDLEAEVPALHAAAGRALAAEAARHGGRVPDLFALVRVVALRISVERLIGPGVLRAAGAAFLDAFMAFQDQLEDATAKAAVLPRWLARPLILRPVERLRRGVRERLAAALDDAYASADDDALKPWAVALRSRSRDDAAELASACSSPRRRTRDRRGAGAGVRAAGRRRDGRARAPTPPRRRLPTATTLGRCDGLRRTLETLVTAHAIGGVRTVLDPDGFDLGGDGVGEAPLWAAPGETIALAHIAAHRDDALWGDGPAIDGESFRPERREWDRVDGDGGGLSGWLRRTPDDYTFTTFSQGLHRCPGERTALVVVACVLAHLLDGPFRTKLRPPVPAPSFERATLAQRDGPVAAVMDSPGEFSGQCTYDIDEKRVPFTSTRNASRSSRSGAP